MEISETLFKSLKSIIESTEHQKAHGLVVIAQKDLEEVRASVERLGRKVEENTRAVEMLSDMLRQAISG
jgi:hypothetical protein